MQLTKSHKPVFALADVNAMYCSCERAFRPDLHNTPIVVLSNNDGCVIAQTKDLKDLDIDMAQPWFEVEEQARARGVVAFSSNYELYANFSNRFAETLRHFTPFVEVYSIDECFLDLTGMNRDLAAYGRQIKDTVLQWTTLPICVGIGHTKTLAKLANKIAKKQERFGGVCELTSMSEAELNALFADLKLKDVWGVGESYALRLQHLGIDNVLKLKQAEPKWIRDQFGVVLERTVKELNGEVWLDMQEGPSASKQVMSSRSFGARVTMKRELEEAISFHAANAAERMRKQKLYANAVHVFIQNSRFDKALPYAPNLTAALPSPTGCTIKITEAALWLLKRIYKPGVYYQKAGVMLMELMPSEGQQVDLFGYSARNPKSNALMISIDGINKKYGRGMAKLASEGVNTTWKMRRDMKSPNYFQWGEMPTIGQTFIAAVD